MSNHSQAGSLSLGVRATGALCSSPEARAELEEVGNASLTHRLVLPRIIQTSKRFGVPIIVIDVIDSPDR